MCDKTQADIVKVPLPSLLQWCLRWGADACAQGYVCPLGQICLEDENPESGLESFDTVYQSALQVFVVASANGVRPSTPPHFHSKLTLILTLLSLFDSL